MQFRIDQNNITALTLAVQRLVNVSDSLQISSLEVGGPSILAIKADSKYFQDSNRGRNPEAR